MSDPLLCDWGHGVSTKDDNLPCGKRATRRIVLHQVQDGVDKEFVACFCPEHFRHVVHLTSPHTPKGGGRRGRKD